ncbi:MAG: hypothetical protein EXR65_01910 [Dehalococcoidia bacterium]|nr:hypothetical protein [Dehalococcoidia bacterium]
MAGPVRHPLRAAPPLALALLAVCALLLAGCRREPQPPAGFQRIPREAAGAPRAYQIGFSALPAELTDAAYLASFDLAANYGELLLIQRAPAWADFMPGRSPSDQLNDATLRERAALQERGLQLLYALDPFDPADRGRLASPPPGYASKQLSDGDLRHAYVLNARYIALNYRPAYMALGTEVNATFERDPAAYRAFVEAYAEVYRAVREASPETRVFVTFQYEQLLGIVPWEPPHVPRWELLDDFAGRLDLFAITTFPSFVYQVARKVPPRYYSQLREHSSAPVAFAAAGYASSAGRDGLNSSTAAEQRRFLQRLLRDADELGAALVVWFAGRDPAFATQPPYDLLASIGLRTADDRPKEGWPVWEEAVRRPFDPSTPPVPQTPQPEQ